ncbi:hypothetical protein [Mycolicibacterium smegmatis]|uniref:Mycothiol-dependent maleylpyruvate isomerase metal-binding domain-containing protein n=1 Tax=Mycolicibacterium smegmatis (strain MKD8) TaxID=1214915 RepID=A0A2U9Q1J8_MYCSE|nr:hypothetical protein [Mycolicibacterium smegmatis]AWT57605.1 hypothetical protein D806_066730 [Mycolicibacterium smegmatis MKD8]
MNELSSAQTALTALRQVLRVVTPDDLELPTPCPGFDAAALDRLVAYTGRVPTR